MADLNKEMPQVPYPSPNDSDADSDVKVEETELTPIVQPPIPTAEEVNLAIAMENERRAELNRQTAPPNSFSKAKRNKTKILRIAPRQTGSRHDPYWNKPYYMSRAILCEDPCHCGTLFAWESYIVRFYNYAVNVPTGQPLNPYNVVLPSWGECSLYTDCKCLLLLHQHVLATHHLHFSVDHSYKLGNTTLDLSVPVKICPGSLLPNLWQHLNHNWNARFGPGFCHLVKISPQPFDQILWQFSCYVTKYGSFKRAFELLNDSLGDSQIYPVASTRAYDAAPVVNKIGYFQLAALFTTGFAGRDIPSARKFYWDMRQRVSIERANQIKKQCRAWFNHRKNSVVWGNSRQYIQVKNTPELKAAIKFLEVSGNIYTYVRQWCGLSKEALRFCLSDVLEVASYYWRTDHVDYCQHGNLFVDMPYLDCGNHICTHFKHTGSHVDRNPHVCFCKITYDREEYRRRDYPTNDDDDPQPGCSTDEPVFPSTTKPSSYTDKFFEFCKRFKPSENLSQEELSAYPEEGSTGFVHSSGPSAWLERAVDYFFKSFSAFIRQQFSEFKNFITSIINSIKSTCSSILSGLGDILYSMASPFVKVLDKFLEFTQLKQFALNRDLTIDFYTFLVGLLFWNYTENPVLRILIILYYFNHFNVLTSAKEFLQYLKKNFYNKEAEFQEDQFDEDDDDDERDKQSNMFISFITYLSTSNVTSVMIKVCCGLVVMITGVAATAANRASLASFFVNVFRNLGFVGQGLTGLEKIWKVVAEFFPKLLKWVREKLHLQNAEDIEAAQLASEQEEISEQVFRFIVFTQAWNTDEGISFIKRDIGMQKKIVNLRPTAVKLKAASVNCRFASIFNGSLLREFNIVYKDFTKLYNIVYRVCAFGNFRQTPFHIQLMGDPGIGKSTLVQVITKNLRDTYFPDVTMSHCVYTRGNTDHFDGYSNQPIMVQDDMWSSDDYKQVSEILPLVSSVPLIVPMAELVDKGTFFDSKFIVSTTNTAFPVTTAVRCQNAIWRRRHIFAHVEMDMDCFDKQNSCVDVEKVKTKYQMSMDEVTCNMPHLKFTINSPLPGSGANKVPLTVVEYDDNDVPTGLTKPLVGLSYHDFMTQVKSRYQVLRDREKMIAPEVQILKSTRELSELANSAMRLRQNPLLLDFVGFDEWLEDTEDSSDVSFDDDAVSSEAVRITEDISDEVCEEVRESNDLITDQESNDNDIGNLLEPEELEVYGDCLKGNFNTCVKHAQALKVILSKYSGRLSAISESLIVGWINRGEAGVCPEDQVRLDALKRLKSIPNPSPLHKQRIKVLEKIIAGHTVRLDEPIPAQEPCCKDEGYCPVAGEMFGPDPLAFDVHGDRVYRRGKPTVIVANHEDPNFYIRICPCIFPDALSTLDEQFNKPRFNSIFSIFDWSESVRNSGIYFPTTFNPKQLQQEALLESFKGSRYYHGGLRYEIEANWDKLSSFPVGFLSRITIKEFATPYIEDRKQNYYMASDFAYRHHKSGEDKIGAFTMDQWEAQMSHFIHVVKKHMNYNEKLAFQTLLDSDHRQRFARQRSDIVIFDSPLFYSTKFQSLYRTFLSLPVSLQHLIVHYNDSGNFQKWYELEMIQINARQVLRYAMARYSGLLHKKPVAWIVGLADVTITCILAAYAFGVICLLKKGICGLLGVKDNPTSRVLFKRSVPPNLARRNVPTSSHVEDIHRKLQHNIVYLKSPRSGYANGLGIDGQMILCNTHWIRRDYEAGEDFTIEWRPTYNSPEMWEARIKISDIYIIPNSDAAVITSVDFRFFSRINHLFLKQSDLSKFEVPPFIHQTCVNSDMQVCWNTYSVQGILDSFKVDFLDNTISKVVEYRTPRVVGISGSPVFADLPYAQGRTIFGIQSCGNSYTCKAAIITQEDLAAIPFRTIVHDGPVLMKDKESCTGILVSEHLVKVGSLPPEYVTGIVKKTAFSQTIFSTHFPSSRIPAVLSAFDPRVPEGTHPLAHSVNKFGRNVIKCMPTEILDEAISATSRMIRARLKRPLRELSLEESILGLKEEGFEKINIKTSPGLPWLWDKKLPGKKDWVQIGEDGGIDLLDPMVAHVFDFHDRLLNQGVIPANSFYEFPKDELRPIEKVIGPPMKTRSISVMNFIFSLLYRKYNLDLEASLHTFADGTFPLCVGINPMSSSWHRMYEELTRRNHEGNDFDISNWDGHFPGWLFEAVTRVTDECYGESSVPRLALNLNACYGFTNFADLVLQKNRGMPSGFAGTANVNTMGHFIVFYCFYVILCKRNNIIYSLDDFLFFISVFFYGDDVIFTISPIYQEKGITPGAFINLYREFGWPITSATKDTTPDEPRPVLDLQFLKRTFQPDPLLGFAVVYGKIEKSVIYDLLHWQRKTPNELEQLYININEALEFSYCHGMDFYNSILSTVNSILRRFNCAQMLVSYGEMRSRILSRYFGHSDTF